MTTNQKIKTSIKAAIRENNFALASNQLLALPTHEVWRILFKGKGINNEGFTEYFCDVFCFQKSDEVFLHDHSEIILNWYFQSTFERSIKLEKMLAQHYPQQFCQAIKRNKAFLKNDFLDDFLNYSWPDSYSIDLIAWKQLSLRHASLQKKISNYWQGIKHLKLEQLLCEVICWIDEQFYLEDSEPNRERLRRIYNYAVSFVFNHKQPKVRLSEENFDKTFTLAVHGKRKVNSFLLWIEEWIRFETRVLQSYCFDDNCQTSLKDGVVHFDFESQAVYKKWQDDTKRYLVNAERYFAEGIEFHDVAEEMEIANIPKGRSERDENINRITYIHSWQSALFLTDLHIRNFILGDDRTHISKLISALRTFAANRYDRYVEAMRSYLRVGLPWNQSTTFVIRDSVKNKNLNTPFSYIYESTESLTKLFEYATPELKSEEIATLIQYLSWEIQPNYEFDPFYIRYSVAETPFLRLGNYLLAPTSLFATNDWFYSLGQRALNLYSSNSHSGERQQTSVEMEVFLGEEFSKRGWKVKVTNNTDSEKMAGDIDLLVSDDSMQLLIQLKRTKFRLDLATLYKEKFEIDLVAAGQLNDAAYYLRNHSITELEILNNHEKWIVTNSFEGVLEEIYGCLKVNYFDILWALKYQGKRLATVTEFAAYVRGDGPFEDCRHYLDIDYSHQF
jgi:hypothetical protein